MWRGPRGSKQTERTAEASSSAGQGERSHTLSCGPISPRHSPQSRSPSVGSQSPYSDYEENHDDHYQSDGGRSARSGSSSPQAPPWGPYEKYISSRGTHNQYGDCFIPRGQICNFTNTRSGPVASDDHTKKVFDRAASAKEKWLKDNGYPASSASQATV